MVRVRTQSRVRRLKWVGTVFCLFVALVISHTIKREVLWTRSRCLGQKEDVFRIGLAGGAVAADCSLQPRWSTRSIVLYTNLTRGASGFEVQEYYKAFEPRPRMVRLNLSGNASPPPGMHRIVVPLWPLLAAAGPPTVYLWYRDRRKRPGHCKKCGYNLTGNVSGACPECGEGI